MMSLREEDEGYVLEIVDLVDEDVAADGVIEPEGSYLPSYTICGSHRVPRSCHPSTTSTDNTHQPSSIARVIDTARYITMTMEAIQIVLCRYYICSMQTTARISFAQPFYILLIRRS
jgi:hypothetical protein